MKKIKLFVIALIVLCNASVAQNTFPSSGRAGIATTTPASTAILDIDTTGMGVLLPRMTKVQRDAIVTPATGLLIYQTNNTPGFYYYSGTAWTAVTPVSANKTLGNLTAPTAVSQSLLPNITNSKDLGSSALRWQNGYIDSLTFLNGSTQTVAFTPYAAGAGINISGNTITNSSPDVAVNINAGSGVSVTGSYPNFTVDATGSTQWSNNGNSIYYNSGNIGIGTTNPSSKLHVVSSAPNVTSFDGASGMFLGLYESGVYRGYIGSYSGFASDVDFGTGVGNTTGNVNLSIQGTPYVTLTALGKLGIGTSTPAAQVHIINNSTVTNPQLLLSENDNDFARLNFKNNTSSNYYAIAGYPSTVNSSAKMNFYYSNYGDVMTVQGDGKVGIGTTIPVANLDLYNSTNSRSLRVIHSHAGYDTLAYINYTGASVLGGSYWGPYGMYASVLNAGNGSLAIGGRFQSPFIGLVGEGIAYTNTGVAVTGVYAKADVVGSSNVAYGISATISGGSSGSYAGLFTGSVYTTGSYLPSDEKLKENISDYDSGLERLKKLSVKQYTFKTGNLFDKMNLPKGEQIGIMAKELENVFPNLLHDTRVSENDFVDKPVSNAQEINFKAVNYTGLVPVIVKSIQEISSADQLRDEKIMLLQNENNDLKQQLSEMKSCIETLCNAAVAPTKTKTSDEIAEQNILYQNEPNPFNNTTIIPYALSSINSNAQIVIRDLNGKVLKTFSASHNGKGQIELNVNELANGTYTYSLVVNDKCIDTKLMVITK